MLILCSGPDTFRAINKARDLERAFCEKYDKNGMSVEQLSARDGIDELGKRIDTISLFSPKRFIRFDGLLTLNRKNKKDQLAKILAKNSEDAIVVTVEEEAPEFRELETLKTIPKFVHYPFPAPNTAQFEAFVQTKAQESGLSDAQTIKIIAQNTFPDSWLAINEIIKAVAGGTLLAKEEQKNPYSWAEDVLLNPKKKAELLSQNSDEDALPALLSAIRLIARIKGNQTQGLQPFVVQKLRSRVSNVSAEHELLLITQALLMQRAGFGSDEELLALI